MRAHELIEWFRDKRADHEPFEYLAEFLQTAAPDEVDQFAFEALVELPNGGTFFDTALSHVSRDGLRRLVEHCVATIASGDSGEAHESVLAYASLQFPQDLRMYLRSLFELRPNADAYYENWPWRGAGDEDVSFLSGVLASQQAECGFKAWLCLLQTRRPDAMAEAAAVAERVALDEPPERYFLEVGFSASRRRLYKESCEHIVFPAGYFLEDRPVWNSRSLHPTWSLPAGTTEYRFGGLGSGNCGLCSGSLHHLITLPASFVFSDPLDASDIRLEVCLSCLGWEQACLFYRYSGEGRIESLDLGSVKPEFVAEPLREGFVRLAPTPGRWVWQDWALANSRENLHRVGGHPCWIQSADYPDCKACGETMEFLLQLDSDLPTSDAGEWVWGSGGIGYGFRCVSCRVIAFLWQCT